MSVLEIRWGLVPDMTGTQMLPRLVGLDIAKELAFTGRMVSGEEAVELGLATHLADDPARRRSSSPARSHRRTRYAIRGVKTLINMAGQVPLADGFKAEERTMGSLIGSPNNLEAITAYFEKRDPVFHDVDSNPSSAAFDRELPVKRATSRAQRMPERSTPAAERRARSVADGVADEGAWVGGAGEAGRRSPR